MSDFGKEYHRRWYRKRVSTEEGRQKERERQTRFRVTHREYFRKKEQARRDRDREKYNKSIRELRARESPEQKARKSENHKIYYKNNKEHIDALNRARRIRKLEHCREVDRKRTFKKKYGEFWEVADVLLKLELEQRTNPDFREVKKIKYSQDRSKRYYEKKQFAFGKELEGSFMGNIKWGEIEKTHTNSGKCDRISVKRDSKNR